MALIVALTSAAPFLSANKVTPANRGGNPIFMLNISKLGLKKSSAVEPSMRKRRMSHSRRKGDRMSTHVSVERLKVLQNMKENWRPELELQVWAKRQRSADAGWVWLKMLSQVWSE